MLNPWYIIGGVASAVCAKSEIIMWVYIIIYVCISVIAECVVKYPNP